MRNERGITLVELLAAITIFMVISSLFYNVFSNSINNYNNIEKRINAQQEANVILSALTQIHQTSSKYTVSKPSSSQIKIVYTNETSNTSSTQMLGNDKYKSTLEITPIPDGPLCKLETPTSGECTVDLKVSTSAVIKLHMENINNSNDKFEINTTIYRYAKSK